MTDLYADNDDDAREKMRRHIEDTEGRAPLEALRDAYSHRLHRRSNDFDASRGLRLVIAKLRRISPGLPVVARSS